MEETVFMEQLIFLTEEGNLDVQEFLKIAVLDLPFLATTSLISWLATSYRISPFRLFYRH